MKYAKASYECYLQEWEENSVEVLYDEDERPMMIRHVDNGDPLKWNEWLPIELDWAVEEEDYMYAAELRDEILKLK